MSQPNSGLKGKPFYALPDNRRSSAQIIREAKKDLKSKRRPSTPQVADDIRHKTSRNNSRPMSSLSEASITSDASRPPSGIRLKPLKKCVKGKEVIEATNLEPSVKKISLVNRGSANKWSMSDVESSFSEIYSTHDCSEDFSEAILTSEADTKKVKKVSIMEKSENSNQNKITTKKRMSIGNMLIGVEHGDTIEVIPSEIECFSETIKSYFPQLEKLASSGYCKKENYEEIGIEIISEIQQLFLEMKMFSTKFDGKVQLMKFLFKLLDSSSPVLSFNVAKLILQFGVIGKNLSSVFRLLYKLCLDDKNVKIFLELDFIGILLNSLRNIKLKNDREALKYAVLLIFGFSSNSSLWDNLAIHNCHLVLLNILKELCNCDESNIKSCSCLVSKALISLNNLMNMEYVWLEIWKNHELSDLLVELANLYGFDAEIVKNVVSLLRKCSESNTDECKVLLETENMAETLTKIFITHNTDLLVIYEVLSVLGNLLVFDRKFAEVLFQFPNFFDNFAETFNRCLAAETGMLRRGRSVPNSCTQDELKNISYSGYVAQILRVLANLCLNPDVGENLAKDDRLFTPMLDVIEMYRLTQKTDSEEICAVVICVLQTIHNVSYFIIDEEKTVALCVKLAGAVIPLLCETFPCNIRLEACNIVQNLTRMSEVRNFIIKNSLVSAFVNLLIETENNIVCAGYAIVINLLLDKNVKEVFYRDGGITKLLHKMHMCMCRDWKMATVLCQVLLNYCSEESKKPLLENEISHLTKVLQYYTSATAVLKIDGEESKSSWETDFCSVAKPLLEILLKFS